MTLFELEAVGGPWGRRLRRRRAGLHQLPWNELAALPPELRERARWVWTQSAFSEYASAAAFAEISAALLAVAAPIDLVAAASDFVGDELLHAELSARVAMGLGGAVPLWVELQRLVRPPEASGALLRAAELLVRTSCVGEALTVPLLKAARAHSDLPLIREVLLRIVKDESQHAQLGFWFLDWAHERLSDADREHLGRTAAAALQSYAPVFGGSCAPAEALGVLSCDLYDATFADAVRRRVRAPLLARGIVVPADDSA